MRTQLQAISDTLATLQQPDTFLQLAVIAGALVLGWWAAIRVRSRITVSPHPENLPYRARELLFIGAPPVLILGILAAPDGLLHAFGLRADMVDVAVQLIGLLLLIRVAIYVLRVSLSRKAARGFRLRGRSDVTLTLRVAVVARNGATWVFRHRVLIPL